MRLLPYLLTPLLAVFFVVPAASAKDISDQELHAVWGAWKRKCADLGVAENRPSLEKRCLDGVKRGVMELDELRNDQTVSEQMWDICKAESGFNYTGDFHAWAACMRVARTRPGLRDY
ncbi:hypothetical protein [Ralstonia mannitolilytica]|uniref:hypothetical protein n=2 Tax=Ralstonia mannitolilytica TaxID=105219 RepID=UPI0026EAA248|nr:hypothetical protein [Ralstonia mannitolilytica]